MSHIGFRNIESMLRMVTNYLQAQHIRHNMHQKSLRDGRTDAGMGSSNKSTPSISSKMGMHV